MVSQVQQEYKRLSPVPCTKCGYCLPCPNGVNIPINVEYYNSATVFQGSSVMLCRNLYNMMPESQRAGACVACGTCEEKCPQAIAIGSIMAKVREQFSHPG